MTRSSDSLECARFVILSCGQHDFCPMPFNTSAHHRPDIDGLRTIAVLCVMLFHLDEVAGVSTLCPGGFAGVDVFFVISGYVVAGSLLRRKCDTTVGGYLAAFYARRMQRLTPALVLVVPVTAVLMAVLYPDDFPSPMLGEFYASGAIGLVGAANIYYAYGITGSNVRNIHHAITGMGASNETPEGAGAVNYFGGPISSGGGSGSSTGWTHDLSRNPFLHFWSLAVEEQFYFVFPLLMVLAYGRDICSGAPEWRVLRLLGPPKWRPFSLFSLTLGPTFAVCWWATRAEPNFAFYMMPSRLWQLAIGAVLLHCQAIGMPDLFAQLLRRRLVVALLDTISIVLLVVAFTSSEPSNGKFPLPWSLAAVIGTLAFLAAGSAPSRGPDRAPAARAQTASEPVSEQVIEIMDETMKHESGDVHPKLDECREVPVKTQQEQHSLPLSSLPTYRGPLGNSLLATPPLPYLGRLSYPLYLWHWPVIVLFKWHLNIKRPEVQFALALLSLGLSVLTYHLVERPVQQATRKWRPRWIALTGISTIALVATLLGLLHALHRPNASPPRTSPQVCTANAQSLLHSPWSTAEVDVQWRSEANMSSWSPSRVLRDSVFPSRACHCLACYRGLSWGAAANLSTANPSASTVDSGGGACCPLRSPERAVHPSSNSSSQALPLPSAPLPPCFVPVDSSLDPEVDGGIWKGVQYSAGDFLPYLPYTDECFNAMAGPMPLHEAHPRVLTGEFKAPMACLGAPRPTPPRPQRRLFVVGDSHGTMLMPGLQAVFAKEHFDVVHATSGWGCGFMELLNRSTHVYNADLDCSANVREVWAALELHAQANDVVLVVSAIFRFWRRGMTTAPYTYESLGLESIRIHSAFLRRLYLDVLALRGTALVVIDDIFFAPHWGVECFHHGSCLHAATSYYNEYAGYNEYRQTIYRDAMHALVANISMVEVSVANVTARHANTMAGLHFLPVLWESFCIAGMCDMRVPGTETVAYWDDDHLNTQGALYVAPFLACAFEQAGLIPGRA